MNTDVSAGPKQGGMLVYEKKETFLHVSKGISYLYKEAKSRMKALITEQLYNVLESRKKQKKINE